MHFIWRNNFRPLLEDKKRFPDSSFSASASVKGHSPSDARITSGYSWCAPVSDEKHYLQLDFKRLHWVYSITAYGDSTSPKWVATYNLNYTVDSVNWKAKTLVRKSEITTIDNIVICTYYLVYDTLTFIVPCITNYALQVYQGNKNAYDHAATQHLHIETKALRFIPQTYVGQPCMRVDILAESK